MPVIKLIKLSIRCGTNEQRKTLVLEQGELGYTIDHKRLWIGDGVTPGGHVIGNKLHFPTSDKTLLETAQTGDLSYENSLLFQLTGADPSVSTNWTGIYTKTDNNYIQYNANNELTLKYNSIDERSFNPTAASNGITATLSSGLSANVDDSTIYIDSNKISLKPNSITEQYINSSCLSAGIGGGSGNALFVEANPSYFDFVGNALNLKAIPTGSITFDAIDPNWIGDGLVYDTLNQLIYPTLTAANATLQVSNRVVGLKPIATSVSIPFAYITQDVYGRVLETKSTIFTGTTSNNSAPLDVYNGYPGQVTDGSAPGVTLTTFPVISGNPAGAQTTIQLSSAGFIFLDGVVAQDGATIDNIAIPVYNF